MTSRSPPFPVDDAATRTGGAPVQGKTAPVPSWVVAVGVIAAILVITGVVSELPRGDSDITTPVVSRPNDNRATATRSDRTPPTAPSRLPLPGTATRAAADAPADLPAADESSQRPPRASAPQPGRNLLGPSSTTPARPGAQPVEGAAVRTSLAPGANATSTAYFTLGSHEDDVLRIQGTPTSIDRYPASGHETWRYGRSTVTISTRSRQVTEWANRGGNLKVRLPPGTNVTSAEYFTRGSHEDDVLRIQGTPTSIDRYPASGHETWRYGRSTVTISTRSRQVTEWANRGGNLKVRLPPGANATSAEHFTRGSHEDDVLRIQGTPTSIDRYPASGHETWRYGRSTVTISTRSRQVTEWANRGGNLKVRLPPGANATSAEHFTQGSHEDDVLRIQGTPTSIDRYPASGHETWRYGRSTVTISTRSRQVTEWVNRGGNLKVR